MSGFNGYAIAAAQLVSTAIMIKPKRGFVSPTLPNGFVLPDIVAQATIEERHLDRLELTEHPIEQGAAITDHAYILPAEVVLRLGWSASPSIGPNFFNMGLGAAAALGGNVGRGIATAAGLGIAAAGLSNPFTAEDIIRSIYNAILTMYQNRAVFTLYTGKRVYQNMICKMVATETDSYSSKSLPITMECQQLILVNTQTVQLPKSSQSDPSATASTTNRGTQQLMQAK